MSWELRLRAFQPCTYGPEYKSYEKFKEISEKNTDFGQNLDS